MLALAAYLAGIFMVRVNAQQLSRAMQLERAERGLPPGMTFVRTILLVMFSGLASLLISAMLGVVAGLMFLRH